MDVTIAVIGEDPDGELRSLRFWLAGDEDLIDLIDLIDLAEPVEPVEPASQHPSRADRPDRPDRSGTVVVRLGPPGAPAALADAMVAWIRDHGRESVYEVARPDGVSVRVSARRVRQTSGAIVRELITELCRSTDPLTSTGSGSPTSPQ